MQAEYVTLSHFNKAIDEIKFILFEMNKKFVTKEDLKSELKNFATKDDLKAFATKEEVREIVKGVVKEEIYSLEDRLALSVAKIEDIERLEEKMDSMENRFFHQIDMLRDDMRVVKIKLKLA